MIVEFETALVTDYIPKMIPGLKMIKFASEEDSFYQDVRVNKYPAVLIFRDDSNPDFCQKYSVQDDDTLEYHTFFPYIQPYVLRIFVEKQTEAVALRDRVRLFHFRNPYVVFPYDDVPNFNVGLRLLTLSVSTLRPNSDPKGAQREVSALFAANLVLKDTESIPLIQEVSTKIEFVTNIPKKTLLSRFKSIIRI